MINQANSTLSTLRNFFSSNKEQINPHEYEICMRNSIVVSTLLGKDSEEIAQYINELNEKTDGNDPLIEKIHNCTEKIESI